MNVKTKLLAIAAATTFAGSAFAGDSGFYIGADVGTSKQGASGANTSEHPTVGGIYGGYNFDKNFGIEANYSYFGKSKIEGQSDVETQALGVDFVGRYAATDRLSVYGKVGLAYVDRQLDIAGGGSDSKSGMAGKFGVGAEYKLTNNLGVRAELAHYAGAPKFEGPGYEYDDKFTTFTMGMNYHF